MTAPRRTTARAATRRGPVGDPPQIAMTLAGRRTSPATSAIRRRCPGTAIAMMPVAAAPGTCSPASRGRCVMRRLLRAQRVLRDMGSLQRATPRGHDGPGIPMVRRDGAPGRALCAPPQNFFRWHGSGRPPGRVALAKIIGVLLAHAGGETAGPTREYHIVADVARSGVRIPENLCVRLGAHMIDTRP